MLGRQIARQYLGAQLARQVVARRFVSGEPPIMSEVRQMLKDAMRSGDAVTKDTIRAVMSTVKNANIDKPESVSTDFAFHSLVGTLIRKRQSSAQEYAKAGRPDLADKENSEIEVLNKLQAKVPVANSDDVLARLELFILANKIDKSAKNFMQQMMTKIPWQTVESQWGMPKKEIVLLIKEMAIQKPAN
jgi:uncharacterized protein YqeY